MNNFLDQEFFNRPTLEVAENLIGQIITNGKENLVINEVEAYDGTNDLACHASKGLTLRTKIMFGPAGNFYVYICYGMHWMLNIVTGPKDYPSAILIRGAGDISGPARLTKYLNINKSLNGKPATPESGIWFEPAPKRKHKLPIEKTPRIGVDYAGPVWSKKPYRFVLFKRTSHTPLKSTHSSKTK